MDKHGFRLYNMHFFGYLSLNSYLSLSLRMCRVCTNCITDHLFFFSRAKSLSSPYVVFTNLSHTSNELKSLFSGKTWENFALKFSNQHPIHMLQFRNHEHNVLCVRLTRLSLRVIKWIEKSNTEQLSWFDLNAMVLVGTWNDFEICNFKLLLRWSKWSLKGSN